MSTEVQDKIINTEQCVNTETAQITHGEAPGVMDTILFSNIINVLFVVILFIWLFRKFNLLSFIGKRRNEILETIKNLEEEKEIKQRQLEQVKTKIKNVDQETAKMIKESEQVAKSISERIINEAKEEAADLNKKAHSLIETEGKVAQNQLTNEVTTAAFAIAEDHIKEAIDENMQYKYINEFIDNLDSIKV